MSPTRNVGHIVFCPATLLKLMIATTSALVVLHLVGLYLNFGLGRDYALGFVPLFDLDNEGNAPTLYNSILLVCAGLLALTAAISAPEFRWRWRIIGLILLVLGVDETFGLHEPIFFVLRGNQSAATAGWATLFGDLEFPDLLPWIAGVIVVMCVWYWPLVRQAGRISILGIGACAVYLFGALGLDLLTAAERAGEFSVGEIVVLGTIEEIAELLGSNLFVYTVARYIVEVQDTTISLSRRA